MDDAFAEIARVALAQTRSASAAIFMFDSSQSLRLVGAAGISGDPLDRLVSAVASPQHPITRTATDGETAFDVRPLAPGGPALRSHVAIVVPGSPGRVAGVLALAHEEPLTEDERRAATDLAVHAGALA